MLLLSNGVQIHLLFLPITGPEYHFWVFGGELPANIYYFGVFTVRHTVNMSLTRDEDREGKHQLLDITSTHPKCQKVNLMSDRAKGERALLTAPC